MAEEHCSDNAFVPETQMDPGDYIDISSGVSDVDTIPEMQIDLDSELNHQTGIKFLIYVTAVGLRASNSRNTSVGWR